MSLEDPFFVVRDEVSNALNKARQLYERWSELINDSAGVTKEEIEWTTTELRNGLRSIEWDLEDLEETVGIVESNPRKFKFDDQEISNRRQFITETRDEVTLMKEHVADAGKPGAQSKRATVASLMNSGLNAVTAAASGESTKYSKLRNEVDSPSHMLSSPESSELNVDLGHHQSLLLRGQSDEQDLEKLKQSVGQLKEITSRVGRQTDEHRVMLEEIGGEVEVTTSRMDYAMKKVARVLGLSGDRRQWAAIGLLSLLLLVVIFFFAI